MIKRTKTGDKPEKWGFDKRVSVATGVNLLQLVTIIWFGAAFYTQTNERFGAISEQRKLQNEQMLAMQVSQLKMQESIGQTLIQIASMTARQDSQTDLIKDIRDSLKIHK